MKINTIENNIKTTQLQCLSLIQSVILWIATVTWQILEGFWYFLFSDMAWILLVCSINGGIFPAVSPWCWRLFHRRNSSVREGTTVSRTVWWDPTQGLQWHFKSVYCSVFYIGCLQKKALWLWLDTATPPPLFLNIQFDEEFWITWKFLCYFVLFWLVLKKIL